jgi:hypothetical protein
MEGSCRWPSVRCVAGGRGGGAFCFRGGCQRAVNTKLLVETVTVTEVDGFLSSAVH